MNGKTKSFNMACIILIVFLLGISIGIFAITHFSTQNVRDFTIEEIDKEYDWNEEYDNKYYTYQITNNSDEDFNNCRLQVKLEDRNRWFMDYGYSDTFSIRAGETKTISTRTFAEMTKEGNVSNQIVYITKPKIIIEEVNSV